MEVLWQKMKAPFIESFRSAFEIRAAIKMLELKNSFLARHVSGLHLFNGLQGFKVHSGSRYRLHQQQSRNVTARINFVAAVDLNE